ncbi:exopolyphosphatase [Caulobacter sp. CCUG 60055]|uniref:Ppx/GppA phosphatase family protein n=1 Tax=Caulobacter sp. CCUG 60055 TaxID=2100090 RepID=UPI00325AC441|nr:Ppx/GppA family phosphatase [Caulobacteraceae bacterium]MCI3182292.1 exopolyphosphatase [Caulobacter sp. CCUG 60055]
MSEARMPPDGRINDRERFQDGRSGSGEPPCFAALDLGTNNCRLLVATPTPGGFRVVEAYSRIVRLGEGLSQSGRLHPDAMDRAMAALRVCADKVRRRKAVRVRAIATQACRSAANGPQFVERVRVETGLNLQIISPREEAQLSVAGCLNLLDRRESAALVVDVGGGSTELSWVDLTGPELDVQARQFAAHRLPIKAWLSIPIGVVTLAELYPETEPGSRAWFRAMVDEVKGRIAAFPHAEPMRAIFEAGRAHLVGTSGAITSLAGLHLGLRRYDRNRVDGLWLSDADCEAAAERLLNLDVTERAAQPCIGPDRADLVLAGAAILQAVQELWPCDRVRVADRGLREGLLLSLMSERNRRRPRRRRRGGRGAPLAMAASA